MCEVLQPLDAELWTLGALDKVRPRLSYSLRLHLSRPVTSAWPNDRGAFNGQLLLLHGLADEMARGLNWREVPFALSLNALRCHTKVARVFMQLLHHARKRLCW